MTDCRKDSYILSGGNICSAVLGKSKYEEKGVDGAARVGSLCSHEAAVPVPDTASETLLEPGLQTSLAPCKNSQRNTTKRRLQG